MIDFVANGSFAQGNPADNLALVRSLFFPKAGATLGSGTLEVTSQANAYDRRFPADRQFVENVRWEKGDVVFVTLNIPGGSNNDADTWYGTPTKSQTQLDDIAQRTAADHIAGYEPFVASIASNTNAFSKPVLLINGDSHRYRSDNPYSTDVPCVTESAAGEVPCTDNLDLHPGYTVPNFHRIVAHGSTSPLEWVKLKVDEHANAPAGSNAFGPFSWTRVNTGLVGLS